MCQVWNSNMWVHRHYLQNNKGNISRENCLNVTIFGAANLTSWWFCHVFLTLCVLVQPWRCTYLWLLPVWEQQHRILNICLKINVLLLAPMISSKQIALQSTLFALVKKCIPHPSLMVAFFFLAAPSFRDFNNRSSASISLYTQHPLLSHPFQC